MTEYLQPGVYVEERSFPGKLIDGVATFVAGVLLGVAAAIVVDCLRRGGNL